MNITKIYTPKETITTTPKELLPIATSVLKTNLALKPKEHFLVVTDPNMENSEAALWFEAAKALTTHSQMVVFDGMTQNAQEPPTLVTLMMSKSHVIILQTTHSLSHSKARALATKAGARIASLPTVTKDIIARTLRSDYQNIKSHTQDLTEKLTNAATATITAPAGTDLTFSLKGRSAIADTGFMTAPGDFGNLPAGEAFIAPVEGSAQGMLVVDASFADIKLDSPITITIKDGTATDISGAAAAKKLKDMLSTLPDDARNIAEFGIGTNPHTNPRGDVIEAEKAAGTIHIALGRNDGFGGTVSVPFHSDGVILNPTVTLDESTIKLPS